MKKLMLMMVMVTSLFSIGGLAFFAAETTEVDAEDGSIELVGVENFDDVEGALRIEDMYPSLKRTKNLNASEIMNAIDKDDQVSVDGVEYDVEYELANEEIVVSYMGTFVEEEGYKQVRGTTKYYQGITTGITVYSFTGQVLGTGNRYFSIPVTKKTSGSSETYTISSSYATSAGSRGVVPAGHRALVTNRSTAGLRSYVRVESTWKRGLSTYYGRNVWNAPINK